MVQTLRGIEWFKTENMLSRTTKYFELSLK